MKTIRLLFSIAVVTFMLTSCSNDEPTPENEIDHEYLNSLTRGTISDGFEIISWTGTGSGFNKNETDPNSLPIYYKILFLQGKVCLELDLNSDIQDFHPLYFPWELYCTLTEFDNQYIVAAPLNVTKNNKISLNGKELNILSLTNNNMRLGYREDLVYNYEPRSRSLVINYKKLDLSQVDTDKFLYFDSRPEALLDLVRRLRDYFGDTIDVNPYFKDGIKLSESVFNLKKIEENILAGNDWSFEGVCSAAK